MMRGCRFESNTAGLLERTGSRRPNLEGRSVGSFGRRDRGKQATMSLQQTTRLRVALGDYAHTLPLKQQQIASSAVAFDFDRIQPVYKVFGAMVREQAFDVSEMAIVTYLQAKSHGKPLVLLPAVMMGRFQHHCMMYNAEQLGRITPADLPGRRVGVRSFVQTTGVWLRGHLQNDYGVDISSVHWVSFEDAHVAEFRDPAGVERAGPQQNSQDGALRRARGRHLRGRTARRQEAAKRHPESQEARRQWHARHGAAPINHMVVVQEELAGSKPETVGETTGCCWRARVPPDSNRAPSTCCRSGSRPAARPCG